MTSLVGRDAELAGSVRSLLGGRGVVIAGAAGVGKTALAGAIVDLLPRRPGTIWIRATEASRQIPFGALGPLLPAQMSTLHPALVPEFAAARLRERGGGRHHPVLVVDDAQLLDDPSAATILALVVGDRVPVLATVRSGVPVSDAVTTLWKDDLLDRLDLGPLNRAGTRMLLEQRLGGEVASATVELLWGASLGNALYLSELLRFGTETGRLREEAGVWWWRGGADVPPRLGELLQRRLEDLSSAARDALDVLALGAPLPYETLAALVSPEVILELDGSAVVSSDEREGTVLLRFAHPLLHSLAERRLTPARRRTLAARLRTAPAEHVDVVRRATWEDAAADDPNVDLLLAAADSVMLSDPRTAARFARRALPHDPSPRAAIALSAALAEAGDAGPARETLAVAQQRIRSDREWLLTGLEEVSLSLWSDRSPDGALAGLARMRAAGRPGLEDELDTVQALVTLFNAQTAQALRLAETVLDRDPGPNALIRALTVRVGALTLTERSADVLDTIGRLAAALSTTPVAATRSGLAYALIAWARLFHGQGFALPAMVGVSGRWPTAPTHPTPVEPPAAWPLLVGVRHQLAGDWPAAGVALREAFVQQIRGEGLFRSEAAGCLIVVLSEAGHCEEASRLLAESPPDDVALVPGLRLWAEAATAGARRPNPAAGALAIRAAEQAVAAHAIPTALWYLADAARFGPAGPAAQALEQVPGDWRSPLSLARAAGIRARAGGRAIALAEAAEQHAALGLLAHAAELAELAGSRTSAARRDMTGSSAAIRAASVLQRVHARLGQSTGALTGLTQREVEIARLAAAGMSDRSIAESLVVSVRTMQSHLGSVYRKLGIDSRKALADALPTGSSTTPR